MIWKQFQQANHQHLFLSSSSVAEPAYFFSLAQLIFAWAAHYFTAFSISLICIFVTFIINK